MTTSGTFNLEQHEHAVWNLTEFVDVANSLLPAYLPKDATGRTSEDVNARLVRHYATQGLLPEARKEGREARYLFDHLLRLLAVRRLLAEGFSAAAIKQVLDGRSTTEIESLLQGHLRIELIPEPGQAGSVERAEFLKKVRARAGLDRPTPPPAARPAAPQPTPPSAATLFSESQWTRLSILDGLDLFVREDFSLPKNRLGDAQLGQLLQVVLLQLEQRRKGTS